MTRPSFSSEEITSTWPFWYSTPPSAIGRQTKGMSSTEGGGKVRRSGGATSPVALHTAVLSIEGLEPSRKELNIFGLRPPVFACSGVSPQLSQTVSGVDSQKCGNHLWPRPAATTGKPAARAQSTSSQISAG